MKGSHVEYKKIHSFDLMTDHPLTAFLQLAPLYTVVIDNNALLRDSARATQQGHPTLLGRALKSGVLRAVLTSDVLDEYHQHLERIALIHHVEPADMHQVFMAQYAPFVLAVDPPEFESDRISQLQQRDPDDVPTGHLIEWLSPDVVLHNDKHLSKSGYGPKIPNFADLIKAISWDSQKEYVQVATSLGLYLTTTPLAQAGAAGFQWARKNPGPALLGAAMVGLLGWAYLQDPDRKKQFQEKLDSVKRTLWLFLEKLHEELENITFNIEMGRPERERNATPVIGCGHLEDAVVRVLVRARRPLRVPEIRERLKDHWAEDVPRNLQEVLLGHEDCLLTEAGWVLNWPTVERILQQRPRPAHPA